MTTKISIPALRTSHDDAYVSHVADAIAKITGTHPDLCACGNAVIAHGDHECWRCISEGIKRRSRARDARDIRLAAIAKAQKWTLQCEQCCCLAPSLREGLCDPCRGYEYAEPIQAVIDDDCLPADATECRGCGEIDRVSERGLCAACEHHAIDVERRMQDRDNSHGDAS